ncbi:hypothetical protein BGW39_003172, partial [Mortierella sp. 14UC]
ALQLANHAFGNLLEGAVEDNEATFEILLQGHHRCCRHQLGATRLDRRTRDSSRARSGLMSWRARAIGVCRRVQEHCDWSGSGPVGQ